ncbi:MAG: CDP-diacylglycerol--glycerol-3-phosphate 3-phosphatidyltransferase [Candidatus Aminicenantes bacterium]|nr:CDP-diacylglycerol--glycerol-3-phosphate 3-phosphatidyltransferase [Candidatus Aminicenantes bacterium]
MTFPNFLTLFRIISIPALVIILLTNFQGQAWIAFALWCLSTSTDTLDGYLARRRKQVTIFGQLLDPIADKLLILSALICLVQVGRVPAWMAVIIIGREFAVTGFRAIASSQGLHIKASWLGKMKMILETITIALIILGKEILGNFYFIANVGLWAVIFISIVSAIEYGWRYVPHLSNQS